MQWPFLMREKNQSEAKEWGGGREKYNGNNLSMSREKALQNAKFVGLNDLV